MGSKMDKLMVELNKEVKADLFTKGLGDYSCERIPFTSPRMNYCTHGGLPEGKIIEFLGVEHGGKTTTAMDSVANFQAKERQRHEVDENYVMKSAFWADIENSFDEEWALKLGVDIDSLYMFHPEEQTAEDIFNFITTIVDTGEIGMIVLDSIAAMVSKDEYDKDYDEKSYAGISGPLSRFSKKALMFCRKYKTTLVGINQVRDDMNSTWGGYKTPGGKAWKHACSVRMDFRKGKFLDENGKELSNTVENPNGTYIMMSMIKNKTCPPDRRTGFYTINYYTGIDYLADLIEVAIKFGVVEKSGSWFQVKDLDTGEYLSEKIQGQTSVYNYLEENVDVLRRVEALIDEKCG